MNSETSIFYDIQYKNRNITVNKLNITNKIFTILKDIISGCLQTWIAYRTKFKQTSREAFVTKAKSSTFGLRLASLNLSLCTVIMYKIES